VNVAVERQRGGHRDTAAKREQSGPSLGAAPRPGERAATGPSDTS
jgi:hypothetical protein